jgi:L-ascorbate metabolism protein UlaG (beta-lactamase superfamily)
MKITKFVHSCLLVEMPAPVNRTALFDPGMMSESALDIGKLEYLDDIFITHYHGDHMSIPFIKKLVEKFPNVRITAPGDAVEQLKEAGLSASSEPPDGVTFFDAPHESTEPVFPRPEEIGIHYLDLFSDPGDSHSFTETKAVLALPVTAPWGSNIKAVNLALELKPKYVVPIHDWHWHDDARKGTYDSMEKILKEKGIIFLKMETGIPVTIDV